MSLFARFQLRHELPKMVRHFIRQGFQPEYHLIVVETWRDGWTNRTSAECIDRGDGVRRAAAAGDFATAAQLAYAPPRGYVQVLYINNGRGESHVVSIDGHTHWQATWAMAA